MMSTSIKPQYKPFAFELISQRSDRPQTYTGNCHCGQIKYEVTLSPPFPEHQVACCNCSICRRNGYLLVYPLRKNVKILRGRNNLGKYSFNRHIATHLFCPKCGGSVYIDFEGKEAKDVLGVNVRRHDGLVLLQ